MENFRQLVHKIHPLSEADFNRLWEAGEEIHLPKKTAIIETGEINPSVYFIKKGVVRGYTSDVDREMTFWFVVPGEIAYSTWGYVENKPSPINIVTSTDTIAHHFTKENFHRALDSSGELAIWGRKLFEKLIFSTDQWSLFYSKPLASERYRGLIEKIPDFLQEVPLKEIASFIGVTPQSLSRIRATWMKE